VLPKAGRLPLQNKSNTLYSIGYSDDVLDPVCRLSSSMGAAFKNNGTAILRVPNAPRRVSVRLFELEPDPLVTGPLPPRRTRLWKLHSSLHCSIVGTCFTTGELRQVMGRIGFLGIDKSSDHELHGKAVSLAGQHGQPSKLLLKALDRRHKAAIAKFDSAKWALDLQSLWRDCVNRGEIPGAYWAILTHPASDEDLIHAVFGEIHMLSHLVGAANRADIRRFCQLEAENDGLKEKVARQQAQLRDGIVKRDDTIRALKALLGDAMARHHASAQGNAVIDDAPETAAAIVADLDRRLKREEALRAQSASHHSRRKLL
jgi:hypothetical protein